MAEYKINPRVATINPSKIDLEVTGKNGIRVRSDGSARTTSIEIKDGDSWKSLNHIQRIELIIDCEDDGGLPKVKLTYLVMP